MTWKSYRVTLTRSIEEECCIFVTAADEEAATDKAMDMAAEIADTVWRRDGSTAPSQYNVEKIEPAEHIKRSST